MATNALEFKDRNDEQIVEWAKEKWTQGHEIGRWLADQLYESAKAESEERDKSLREKFPHLIPRVTRDVDTDEEFGEISDANLDSFDEDEDANDFSDGDPDEMST